MDTHNMNDNPAMVAPPRTLYASGWRPAIGWVCVVGLALHFVVFPVLTWVTGKPAPAFDMGTLMTLVAGGLGVSATRTFEKKHGLAR